MLGKTAARELSLHGITSLELVVHHSREELLAIHGVGPKAIQILAGAGCGGLCLQGLLMRHVRRDAGT